MDCINKAISEKKYNECLNICIDNKLYYLGYMLGANISIPDEDFKANMKIIKDYIDNDDTPLVQPPQPPPPPPPTKKVLLLCNWTDSKSLCDDWNKMSKTGDYKWDDIEITWKTYPDPDYTVIINRPPTDYTITPDKTNTIVFQMEPNMKNHPEVWSEEWANPDRENFLHVFTHADDYNNNEWHLSRSYEWLMENMGKIEKTNTISTVLSGKYNDEGHVKRVDFVKFLEKHVDVDVYGDNRFDYKSYMGPLPIRCKDQGLFPYKYTFNGENQLHRNYYTEKLIDGILSECLVFYHGCINVREYIDERAFVQLDLVDFEKDCATIKQAIEEDWWSQRIEYIREAKKKILEQQQFFPRLKSILDKI